MLITLNVFVNYKETSIQVEYNNKEIEMDELQITSVKNTVFPEDIEILDISRNKLKNLKGIPRGLKMLNAALNRITSLEGLPPNLVNLQISDNKIETLDGLEMSNNIIEELYIGNNPIKSIPLNFVEMKNLKSIFIHSIEPIPPSVQAFIDYVEQNYVELD
jgi:Leucine-rich repeat (LRR) protein